MRSLLIIVTMILSVGCDDLNTPTDTADKDLTDTVSKVEYIYMPELVINAGYQEGNDEDVIIFTEEETRQVFEEAQLTVSLKN